MLGFLGKFGKIFSLPSDCLHTGRDGLRVYKYKQLFQKIKLINKIITFV